VRALSGGNQQKVANRPAAPSGGRRPAPRRATRGIDIGSKADVYETVAQQAAAGRAVLIVSSYLPELFGLCDRLAVMCRGRLSPAKPIAQ
jgi:ribose transport system ATP-binding protein